MKAKRTVLGRVPAKLSNRVMSRRSILVLLSAEAIVKPPMSSIMVGENINKPWQHRATCVLYGSICTMRETRVRDAHLSSLVALYNLYDILLLVAQLFRPVNIVIPGFNLARPVEPRDLVTLPIKNRVVLVVDLKLLLTPLLILVNIFIEVDQHLRIYASLVLIVLGDTALNSLVSFILLQSQNISNSFMNFLLISSSFFIFFQRFPWFRIAYFFLWTIVYVIFQWILHSCVRIW